MLGVVSVYLQRNVAHLWRVYLPSVRLERRMRKQGCDHSVLPRHWRLLVYLQLFDSVHSGHYQANLQWLQRLRCLRLKRGLHCDVKGPVLPPQWILQQHLHT